jgi:hypothetical protein
MHCVVLSQAGTRALLARSRNVIDARLRLHFRVRVPRLAARDTKPARYIDAAQMSR